MAVIQNMLDIFVYKSPIDWHKSKLKVKFWQPVTVQFGENLCQCCLLAMTLYWFQCGVRWRYAFCWVPSSYVPRCRYSSSPKSLHNRYIHLTNYSINRSNSEYQSNSKDTVRQGHKWCVSFTAALVFIVCVNESLKTFIYWLCIICLPNIAYWLRMRNFDFISVEFFEMCTILT